MNKGSHYTEHHFELPDNVLLSVTDQTKHSAGVWLGLPGYAAPNRHGFSIEFRPCHLRTLRELVEKLEAQEAGEIGACNCHEDGFWCEHAPELDARGVQLP